MGTATFECVPSVGVGLSEFRPANAMPDQRVSKITVDGTGRPLMHMLCWTRTVSSSTRKALDPRQAPNL